MGLSIALLFLHGTTVFGQSVLNPADSLITYNPAKPAAIPAYGSIQKWLRTVRMSWNTNNWKAYIYNGNQFRLRFPNGYNPTANDGKLYPMMIFMHGEGEGGTVYDNEYSFTHGGQIFDTAVANGTWPGYVLIMQTTGGWGPPQMTAQQFIIDYMIKNNKLDPFRVVLNGLSGGGSGDWELFQSKENYIAGLLPMSSVAIAFSNTDSVAKWKYESIWNIHGGQDGSPAPYTAQQVLLAMQAQGANYTDLDMTTQGHDTWDSTWSMPAFWPWMKAQYCSNPWTLFGRTMFCVGSTINVTVGLEAGYQAYQWRKNGVIIPGATSNTITVTSVGTYDAQVERNGNWSLWSPVPVVIQNPPPTVTPAITVAGLMSKVVPAPDGNTGVTLQEPTGYATYLWEKTGSTTSLAATNTYYAPAGQYVAEVTQQYGCSTSFSAPFTVASANGPNAPSPATALVATDISTTSQRLNWTQNPNPTYQETNFEIYQGTQSGGPYKLIAITGPNVSADTVTGLKAGNKYFYIVRAVDSTAAAANSNEASAATSTDTQPPTAPGGLTITSGTQTSVSLSWTKSTDNVGVTAYNIYVDGVLSNVVTGSTTTTFTVTGLTFQQSYSFYVVAVDAAGNQSPASNQVSGEPLISGLTYSYYTLTGTTTALPNLTRSRATSTGTLTNISLSPATKTTNFAFLFNGYLHVTTAGAYTFKVTSSDGASVYLGTLNGGASPYTGTNTGALINDDGLHNPAASATSASVNLSVGLYPMAVAYFKGASGTPSLTLSWELPGSSTFVTIPTTGFTDTAVVNGTVPAIPTNLAATTLSYNKVSLSWTDNSGGKATTEIWRSTSATTGFTVVGNAAAGVSTFIDSSVSPATKYYYEIKADNVYGESALTSAVNATTQPLPAIPAIPTGLTGKAISYSSVNLSWTNNASNATSIVLYRSATTDQAYVQWAVLSPTAASFVDTGLYANSAYYYKIEAVNAGGSSAFTPEIAVTTLDNVPVITNLPATIQAKYGTTTTYNVSATQPGTGTLTFKAYNLPSFSSFIDNGNRTGTLTITPAAANAGTYPGLYIVVSDAFGGSDTTAFSLTVNNNTPPTLNSIANVTMNEGDTLTLALNGSNVQNPADTLTYSVTGAPARTVLTPVSNGVAKLFLQPSYAAAGVYTVQVTLTDKASALTATQSFTVTVKNKNPNTTIYSRFAYNDVSALGAPWNALLGATTNNLLDSNSNVTTVGLVFSPTTWWNTYNGGSSTGNNSGVYPDAVLQDYYWFGSIYGGPNSISATVTGTDTSQLYDLTFFANSVYSGFGDNGYTTYTANGQTVTLHVQNNTKNTVTIPGIKPAANGTIAFTMGLQNTSQLGYINALVITKHYDDGTAPAGTSRLTATNVPSQVKLSWTDSAYNATGYQVYRSLTGTGNYSLLGTVAGNSANSYIDSSVNSNTGYTYEVQAVNTHGTSGFDSVSIVTQHRLPKITAISNIIMKDTSSLTVNVTTSDDPTAQLTLKAANLPPFASFTDNGNGTGVLTLSPSAGTSGVYTNVSITVADQFDSTATTSFSIAVTEPNVQSIYLSLSGGPVSPAPWNSITTAPFVNTVLNLNDDSGTPSGVAATLLDGWYWYGLTGYLAGNGQGTSPTQSTYPPTVVQNFFYEPTTAQRRIQFSGLNNAKQYNFVFFNSQWDGTNGLTTFTINNDSVQLQADWNVNKTIQINGIVPVNGVVTVVVHKAAAAANAYLNSIVLQAYDTAAGTLIGPADLRATRVTQTTVSLQWQDRSAIETGYELWRATDATGSYTLLASLPAQTTSYMDTKLSKNTNYYYIVRAITGSAQSNFSSVLAVTTYQDAIYIHPTYTSAGNGPTPPWNNLNSSGGIGVTWRNFIDSTGSATSIGMTQTGVFAGPNSLGDVTGNNSGVYPDPILLQQYVLFQGNDGSFTVTGLTLTKTYDFTFFGTEDYETGDQNTTYIVNGDTVYLNALYNQQTIVTLYGVTPNAQGQVNIQMICQGQADAGWFNAMIINGYTPLARNAPSVSQVTGVSSVPTAMTGLSSQFGQIQSTSSTTSTDSVITAYPNPFHTSFTLSVPVFTTNEKVMVTLYDMTGQLVYRKEFDNVQEGTNYLQVGNDGVIGVRGIYTGKVTFASGRASQVIKLIKN